ncbi:PREDICTED: VQ motif-containing protein 9-like [Tarenaya hassleriana]|uniref:VQ motif-containing protein 9-like n=1 Tax=Tarenaya hassleriana TaxID=28532 RepID=UPI00053C50F8|nr:PREDICTED: VQ motif-containing protein 9-like [Tarenaya hassleriana]
MDKSCNSSGDSSAASSTENRDHYLRQLNKFSHKISKPTTTVASAVKRPGFDLNPSIHHQAPPPATSNQGNLHQHQPPVYNINKNDFRDVVQRLTGSPAHERISAPTHQHPPAIHQPKPQSSRLQRIRPPPLANISNRPPPLLNGALFNPVPNPGIPMTSATAGFIPRPAPPPLSPLPPLPPVHAAAESPVSAYMRYLQNSMPGVDSNQKQFSGFSPLAPLVSPRWYQKQENAPPLQNIHHPPATAASIPSPPLGCLSSPKSPYALLSPSILLSPTAGQLGFPLSPTTVPVQSPKYKGR